MAVPYSSPLSDDIYNLYYLTTMQFGNIDSLPDVNIHPSLVDQREAQAGFVTASNFYGSGIASYFGVSAYRRGYMEEYYQESNVGSQPSVGYYLAPVPYEFVNQFVDVYAYQIGQADANLDGYNASPNMYTGELFLSAAVPDGKWGADDVYYAAENALMWAQNGAYYSGLANDNAYNASQSAGAANDAANGAQNSAISAQVTAQEALVTATGVLLYLGGITGIDVLAYQDGIGFNDGIETIYPFQQRLTVAALSNAPLTAIPMVGNKVSATIASTDVTGPLTSQGLTTARAAKLDVITSIVGAIGAWCNTTFNGTNFIDIGNAQVVNPGNMKFRGGMFDSLDLPPNPSTIATAVWANGTRTLTAAVAVSNPGLTGAQQTELDAIKAKTDTLPTTPTSAAGVLALLKADPEWRKIVAYTSGKFDFNPATGVLRLYDADSTTVITTLTLTRDGSGNTTLRNAS